MSARILVVEDEKAIQLALGGLLRKQGHVVHAAYTGAEAFALLEANALDLVVTDLTLGEGASGMDVLRVSKECRPPPAVIMITAHGSERVAVAAMKAGADDYVPKPFDNDELRIVVERTLGRARLEREHRMLLDRVGRERGLGAMIGSGAAMRDVFARIEKVAETDLTVLVRGESGTGKELVAQAIHERSPRSRRPFVAVNCAAMSRDLVESELFGHEKGAFTGAIARRVGRFEAARGGTIFLDEIGDMPIETQAKVLRVLEERSFERVGGNDPISADVRVVAATHRDLEADVKRGAYRADLYYRLRVFEITLPPLRQRVEDLPALTRSLLEQLGTRLGRAPARLRSDALVALARYAFPGNVRELKNLLEQAAVLAGDREIACSDLALADADAPDPGTAEVLRTLENFGEAKRRAVEHFERAFIVDALRRHDGNVSRTAEAIGMVRQSLQQKLRELGIGPDERR